jgi:hypothetical protein
VDRIEMKVLDLCLPKLGIKWCLEFSPSSSAVEDHLKDLAFPRG